MGLTWEWVIMLDGAGHAGSISLPQGKGDEVSNASTLSDGR